MQGYMWSSNQCAPTRYQEQPPPSYQEQNPPPYHQHFPPNYQAATNGQPNMFQTQRKQTIQQTQQCATTQARFSNGQQEATNQWSTSSAFQSNMHGYDQTRQQPLQPSTASNRQQFFSSEKPNTYMYYNQLNQHANTSSTQNSSQAPMNWTSQSNSVSLMGNNRGWTNHIPQNGSSCSTNNQQQLQPLQRAPGHYNQRQQQSGQWQTKHQLTQGHHLRISTKARKDQTLTIQISSNSLTPSSGAHKNVTLPVSNQNQSPVGQNQPVLWVNSGPDVSTTHSVGDQCQGINVGTYKVTQTHQPNRGLRFGNSIIYRLLKENTQQSDNTIVHQNSGPQQSEVCANNSTDHNSKEQFSSQCTGEPPSKRIKPCVAQIDHWNKETSVSKDVLPGTHQIGSNENRLKRTSQHTIQYSTDPTDCLEAVLALQKAAHQSHKAIAIVPPITQQTSNIAQTLDETPKKADSPLLKIDSVCSLHEESDAEKIVSDSKSPSQTTQGDKIVENETESSTAKPDTCSISPTKCQNNMQQSRSDSIEPSFDLSSVPVIEYTLEKLTGLVKTLEAAEMSAGYPEQPQSVLDTILKLYWNGDQVNIWKPLMSFRKDAPHKFEGIVTNLDSVVFNSIETKNLEKLAHCNVLKNGLYSSSEVYKSSWLNVDGHPDIEKVLSEPMLEDKVTPETDNTGITSLNKGVNLPEKSVKPNMYRRSDLFTPLAGNDQEETAPENNGHLYVVTSLSKKQLNNTIDQSHTLNAKCSVISPLVENLADKPTRSIFGQDHSTQISPRDNVSDGTKTLCNSMDTCQVQVISENRNTDKMEAPNHTSDVLQVGDISNCKNPDIKGALNNSSETWLVEDISEDENSENMEVPLKAPNILVVEDGSDNEPVGDKGVLPKASDVWQVEDISDDENSGNKDTLRDPLNRFVVKDISNDEKTGDKKVSHNSSEIWQVEDISDDERSDNKSTLGDSSDIHIVDDVSNDENSSDESFLMGITVLSSEDAKTFFQHLGDEPKSEYNKTNICSLCSTTSIETMLNSESYCLRCWEKAPLLEVEEESDSESEVLCSPATSNDKGENCSPPCLKSTEPNETCIAMKGVTQQKSTVGENCGPLFPELQVEKPTIALLGKCTELDQNLGPPILKPEGKPTVALLGKCTEQDQNLGPPFLEPEVKKPTVASTEQCSSDEIQRDYVVLSNQGQIRSSPSTELNAQESNCALPEKCTEEEFRVRKGVFMEKLQLVLKTASIEQHKRLTSQKLVSETVPKKQKLANSGRNKNRLNKIKFIYTKPRAKKTKLKSASPSPVPDDCELFTPDIVVKKNCPAKKSGETRNCNMAKKFKKHKPERKENVQKVIDKVSDPSNERPVQTPQKEKTTELRKVRFDLYGSKTEELYNAKERRFSPPATLTVSDSCNDYSDVLSAKQKVHNLWSSTFIPKTKTSPSRSNQEEKPKKKRTMKPQDHLKSNMSALKRHLVHRAMLLSNGESRHYRKPLYLSKSV